MSELVLALVSLETVTPTRSHGFAASILGAFMAIGLLAVVAWFATSKPRNRRKPRR